MQHSFNLTLNNEEDTKNLAEILSKNFTAGVIYLIGDLGAGKTTLTRYWLQAMGHKGAVKSPTYTLVEPYNIQSKDIFHFDLYRLNDPEELEFIGFYEYQDEPNSLVIIEWASRAQGYLTPPQLVIDIKRLDDDKREVTLSFAK